MFKLKSVSFEKFTLFSLSKQQKVQIPKRWTLPKGTVFVRINPLSSRSSRSRSEALQSSLGPHASLCVYSVRPQRSSGPSLESCSRSQEIRAEQMEIRRAARRHQHLVWWVTELHFPRTHRGFKHNIQCSVLLQTFVVLFSPGVVHTTARVPRTFERHVWTVLRGKTEMWNNLSLQSVSSLINPSNFVWQYLETFP